MSELRGMNDWVGLARLPWTMWATGLDFMMRAMMPPGYYERYESSWESGGQERRQRSRSESGTQSDDGAREDERSRRSSGDDLSGDDVKLVRYKVLYTKRGQERVLASGEELVSHSTDLAAFGGQKIAQYLANNRNASDIRDEDQRYIKVNLRVLHRFSKESVDYDGRMVDLMERQVDLIGSIGKQVETLGSNMRRAA